MKNAESLRDYSDEKHPKKLKTSRNRSAYHSKSLATEDDTLSQLPDSMIGATLTSNDDVYTFECPSSDRSGRVHRKRKVSAERHNIHSLSHENTSGSHTYGSELSSQQTSYSYHSSQLSDYDYSIQTSKFFTKR